MNNEEVGSTPETESQAERIYVLPLLEEDPGNDFRILVFADGNNRWEDGEDNYDAGGENVISIAQEIAERGDVSVMAVCILSPENIEKRSDDFFLKVYRAFAGLGINIDTKGTLVSQNIRLEPFGDLDSMRQRDGVAGQLASMIEAVCNKTSHIENPSMRLLLGVNYSPNMALDLRVHCIYRSGMEEQGVMRTSGVKANADMALYPSTKLWPEVTPDDIHRVIDDTRKNFRVHFHKGYSSEFIHSFIDLALDWDGRPVDLVIPFDDTLDSIEKVIHRDFEVENESRGISHISVLDQSFHTTHEISTPWDKGMRLQFVHWCGVDQMKIDSSPFNAIIAPGQISPSCLVPEDVDLQYLNIFQTPSSPTEVMNAVRDTLHFLDEHQALKGAERVKELVSEADKERVYYEKLQRLCDDLGPVDSEALCLSARQAGIVPEELSDYDLQSDLLVAKLLRWAQDIGAPTASDHEFRALMNYIHMSYMIGHDLRKSELIARYMILVYAGDQGVFDKDIAGENSEKRVQRLKDASMKFQHSIASGVLPEKANDSIVSLITAEWIPFLDQFKGVSHPQILDGWISDLLCLYEASVNEYDPQVTDNPFPALLFKDGEKRSLEELLPQKYFRNAPSVIIDRIRALYDAFRTGDMLPENTFNAQNEITILLYLTDVYGGIGAGLVYQTEALDLPHDSISSEMIELLQEVSHVSDYYNRLANDISGFFRSTRDLKKDSLRILIEINSRSMDESLAVIESLSQLRQIYSWLQEKFQESLNQLEKKWPYMAETVKRGCVGIEIYKDTHPQDLSLVKMRQLRRNFLK